MRPERRARLDGRRRGGDPHRADRKRGDRALAGGERLIARVDAEAGLRAGTRTRVGAAWHAHLFDAKRAGDGMDVRHRRQLALMLAPYALGLGARRRVPALVTFGLALTEYDLIRAPTSSASTTSAGLGDEVFGPHSSTRSSSRPSRCRCGSAPHWGSRCCCTGAAAAPARHARRGYCRPSCRMSRTGCSGSGSESALRPADAVPRRARTQRTDDLGAAAPQFLTDPNDARAAIVLMSLFTIGEGFLLLLAARQAVPAELYELAAIEDATRGPSSGGSRSRCSPRSSSSCSCETRSSASSSTSCPR